MKTNTDQQRIDFLETQMAWVQPHREDEGALPTWRVYTYSPDEPICIGEGVDYREAIDDAIENQQQNS